MCCAVTLATRHLAQSEASSGIQCSMIQYLIKTEHHLTFVDEII